MPPLENTGDHRTSDSLLTRLIDAVPQPPSVSDFVHVHACLLLLGHSAGLPFMISSPLQMTLSAITSFSFAYTWINLRISANTRRIEKRREAMKTNARKTEAIKMAMLRAIEADGKMCEDYKGEAIKAIEENRIDDLREYWPDGCDIGERGGLGPAGRDGEGDNNEGAAV